MNEDLKNNLPTIVTCPICGETIPDTNIENWNGCNEEGEDYGKVTATCEKCSGEYETYQWGEWQNFEEAKERLNEYLKEDYSKPSK